MDREALARLALELACQDQQGHAAVTVAEAAQVYFDWLIKNAAEPRLAAQAA